MTAERRTARFVGRGATPTARAGRFGGVRPGGRQLERRRAPRPAVGRRGRRAPQADRSPLALVRGLLGTLGASTAGTGAKGSRRGPALLAIAGGVGAAGAAAFKRRRSQQGTPAGPQTRTPPG